MLRGLADMTGRFGCPACSCVLQSGVPAGPMMGVAWGREGGHRV